MKYIFHISTFSLLCRASPFVVKFMVQVVARDAMSTSRWHLLVSRSWQLSLLVSLSLNIEHHVHLMLKDLLKLIRLVKYDANLKSSYESFYLSFLKSSLKRL